ncbi:MAG TPA: methyltransferase domain-containing protein [Candidatus Sulfotelmatobacter sp.]|nr:methyltransferase domain-containing protein [Candidatus Sulfotelmatobacter sp.]
MAVGSQVYAAPFDEAASSYDRTFTNSTIGRAQRLSVWEELAKTFHAGDQILEIGCGTGVDACYLAERGVRVLACDSSPKMIEVATRRLKDSPRLQLVQTQVLAAGHLGSLRGQRLFDGAFSNFGALNCVADLKSLAADLAALLRPGAAALLCWMGPFCLWETVWYLLHGKPAKALRRLHREGITTRVDGGMPLTVYYPSVWMLARMFAPHFKIKSIKGIGVAVPPSYLEPYASRLPQLLNAAILVDRMLGRCAGVRLLGDHILIRLERESDSSA